MGIGTAVGAGLQGVQAITSGVQGKKAQGALNKQVESSNQMYNQMLGMGNQAYQGLSNAMGAFADPRMPSGGGAAAGKGAGQGSGGLQMGGGMSNAMAGNAPGGGTTLSQTVLNQAAGMGGKLEDIARKAGEQIGAGGYLDQARNLVGGAGNFNQFDFNPVQQNLGQATQLAQDMAARARTQATNQMAGSVQQSQQALAQQLGSRGLSGNSGVAAAALAGLNAQNAMATSQLEANLANQAGAMGLQAAQLDTANLLQQQGMASNYNLGMNQLGAQTALGQAGALTGMQQIGDQQALMRAGLMNEAALNGFNTLQGTYQQNYLAPQMQMQSMLAGLGGQLAGLGAGGLAGNTELMAKGVQQAGSGKGSALGGLAGAAGGLNSIGSFIQQDGMRPKNWTPPTSPGGIVPVSRTNNSVWTTGSQWTTPGR